MRNLARLATILGGVVGAAGAMSLLMVGCSGDDTVVPTSDSGLPDVTVADAARDVATDSTVPDTGTDAADAGHADAADAAHADAADAGHQDASDHDANTDHDAACTDAGGDAACDAGPALDISLLIRQAAINYCTTYAACCNAVDAGAGVDSGTFDIDFCWQTRITNYGGFSFLNSHLGALRMDAGAEAGVVNNPHIAYNDASAAACLTLASSYACEIAATDYSQLTELCYGAYTGLVAQGDACTDSIECAAGRCLAGVCAPLAATGAACITSEDCAYRGTTATTGASYCDSPDGVTAGVCVTPRLVLNSACADVYDYETECATGVCDDTTLTCSNTFTQIKYCSLYQR